MFKNFADVIEAAQNRRNEIVYQIDDLRHKVEELRWQIEPLENQEEPLTAEQDEQLYQLDRQRLEIEDQIYELDDHKYKVAYFLDNFTNAFYKSRNIDDFVLYLEGYSPAQVHGDVEDLYPNW